MLDGAGTVWRCPPDAVPREVAVASGDALVTPTRWGFSSGPMLMLTPLCVSCVLRCRRGLVWTRRKGRRSEQENERFQFVVS